MATALTTTTTTGSGDLDQIFHLAAAILPSGMLPDHIKSEGAAVAIILAGRELGLPPMVSLRTIRLVKGNVTIDASQQLALVHAAGWRSTWKESTNQAATLELSRAGQDPHLQTFTIQDAKLAGLTGKDPWRKYPAAMLRARCISAAVRAACPGVLSGVYTPEELETETEEGRPPIEVIDLDDPAVQPSSAEKPPELSNHLAQLQDHLRRQFGSKVEIRLTDLQSGRIVIPFANADEFQRVVRVLERRVA